MTRLGAVLMLVCVAGVSDGRPLLAQSPARDLADSIAPPSGTGLIAGTVVDEAGHPVRRATVTVTGDMRLERTAVTDHEGRFALSDLPPGRFAVRADKPGYPAVSYGARRPNREGAGIFLKEGQHANAIDLVLGRGAAITGTVYDEQGTPLPGVPVQAWEVRTALSGDRTLEFGDPEVVTTDDRGVYRVFGLAPGDYTVGTSWYYGGDPQAATVPTPAEYRAAFPGPNQRPTPLPKPSQPVPDPPVFNYSPVFSPGVVDPLAADVVTLKTGDVRTGMDLRMQFLPTAGLDGTIVNPAGTAVGLRMTLGRNGPIEALNSARVFPGLDDMTFSLSSLTPGPYRLLVETRPGIEGPPLWAMTDVLLNPGERSSVRVTLQPSVTVTGRLVFEGTALPPPTDLTRVRVTLSQIPSSMARSTSTTDAEGAVSITGVIPGRYLVRASVPGGVPSSGAAWTVQSVTVGGVDVTDREFDLSPAGASDLTVTFTDQLSELSGLLTTQSGVPETDYFVIAIPADQALWTERTRRIVSTRPDGTGRYVFTGLPAGDYRIAVTTDLIPSDLRDRSALSQLAEQSLEVTIGTGEHKTLNIQTGGGAP